MFHDNTLALSPKSLPQDIQDDKSSMDSISQFAENTFSLEENLSPEYIQLLDVFPEQFLSQPIEVVEQSISQYNDVKDLRAYSIPRIESQTILTQCWRPCSGEISIGEHLDCIQFPVSYRDLVYRWIALGRPNLLNFRVPISIRSTINYGIEGSLSSTQTKYTSEVSDLQQLCERQESSIIDSIKTYFKTGQLQSSISFIEFASHLEIYSALHAELTCLESSYLENTSMQRWLYEKNWRDMLKAFEIDRTICKARYSHQCFWKLLWGEVYDWSTRKIKEEFNIFKVQFSSIRSAQVSLAMQESLAIRCNLTSSSSFPSFGDRETTVEPLVTQSVSLPSCLSAFGLSVSDIDTPNISTVGYTSYWNSTSGLDTFDSPSSGMISTPSASPRQNNTHEEDLSYKQSATEQKYKDTTTVLQRQIIGLQIDSDSNRSQSRCSSQAAPERAQSPIFTSYSPSHSPAFKKNVDGQVKALPSESLLFKEYSEQLLKERRGSSIGSSFDSSEANYKIDHYRTILKDVANQLVIASRLLSDQATSLYTRTSTESQLHEAASIAATACAVATEAIKSPLKRARLTDSNDIRRPVRPRSQTTL